MMESIKQNTNIQIEPPERLEDILLDVKLIPFLNEEKRKEKIGIIRNELKKRAKILGIKSAENIYDFVKKLKPLESKLTKHVKAMFNAGDEFVKIHNQLQEAYEDGFIIKKEFFTPDERAVEFYVKAGNVYRKMLNLAVENSNISSFEKILYTQNKLKVKFNTLFINKFVSDLRNDKETMNILWNAKFFEIKADAKALQVFDSLLNGVEVIIYPHCGYDLRPNVAFSQQIVMASCLNSQDIPESLYGLKVREKAEEKKDEKVLLPKEPTKELLGKLSKNYRLGAIWCSVDTLKKALDEAKNSGETCIYWGFNGKLDDFKKFAEVYNPKAVITTFDLNKETLEFLNKSKYVEYVADDENLYRRIFSKTRNKTVNEIIEKSAVTNDFYVPRFFMKEEN